MVKGDVDEMAARFVILDTVTDEQLTDFGSRIVSIVISIHSQAETDNIRLIGLRLVSCFNFISRSIVVVARDHH